MIAFWISAALVSAAAAALIIHRAARAMRVGGGEDPALAVYRRQLTEIDDLAAQGLLLDEEKRSAHAEAARRLLAAAEAPAAPVPIKAGGRLVIAIVAGLVPLAAVGVYLLIGRPDFPDQPFVKRLAAWRAADPASLTPEQMTAVLELVAQERPKDPKVEYYLARAQMEAGDGYSAVHSLERAIDLDPRNAELWTTLAEAEMAQDAGGSGEPGDDAVKAFQRALAIDPKAATPRYYLARAQIARGDVDGGLAAWRALDQDLAANDPRRQALDQDIAVVAQTRSLPQVAAQPSDQGQQAFIRAMVASLAARLRDRPEDPEGWARLVRSYTVLGDAAGRDAALAKARVIYKDHPEVMRQIEQAAAGPQ